MSIFNSSFCNTTSDLKAIVNNIDDYDICPCTIYEACLVNHSFSEDKFDDINNTIDFIINKIEK